MRWVSLEAARAAAAESLKRFPLPLLCAWTAAALADVLIFTSEGHYHPHLIAAALAATLGISLFFAVTLLGERLSGRGRLGPQHVFALVGLLVLVLVAVSWPKWSEPIQVRRYAQLGLLMHALVAFVPYLTVREPNGFWQYNRTLLMRLIVASIFSSVLLAGLDGALFALKPLFGVKVSPKVYLVLTSSVYLIFHPWFFLAGIPRDLSSLERRTDYPGVIRVFAQFILVPLVAIYQALLTAYLVKVIFTGQWPSGLIGWLVSAEAVFGILAILLIHPVRDLPENRWVGTFARAFYVALIPSIAMLAMAIAKRIGQYGVTEDRYFVVVLTGWLALISAYFIARRDGDIRVIPITLAALAVLTLAGPWGAYSISRGSQTRRLERLLEHQGLLVHGAVHPAAVEPPLEVERNISSVLDYLVKTHGFDPIRRVLGEYAMVADQGPRRPEPDMNRVMKRLGMHHIERWESGNQRQVTYNRNWTTGLEAQALAGYAYHVHVDRAPPIVLRVDGVRLNLSIDGASRRLILAREADSLAVFDLGPALDQADRTPSPADSSDHGIRLVSVAGSSPALLEIIQLYANDDGDLQVYGFNADLYFSLNPH